LGLLGKVIVTVIHDRTAVAAIRFQEIGKLYYFDLGGAPDIEVGDYVVVETSRGRELGHVAGFVEERITPPKGGWKPIERKATPRDLVMSRIWAKQEIAALIDCRELASELEISDCKFVKAEYAFDGSRLTFLYTSEGDERGDLKQLRNALKRVFRNARIELRQIGPRDAAKLIKGLGACGLEARCCSLFLDEFSPISIKMAKAQGISLNPQEITGMCGRLRCCLLYESQQYVEANKQLPKIKKKVITPQGVGRVISRIPLELAVVVELENGNRAQFGKHEVQPYEEYKALNEKSEQGCGNGEGGECICGKR
jgi:cell fate regulator YaaT (PSP1 superfamily)